MSMLEETDRVESRRLPRFLTFLVKVADGIAEVAQEEDAGEITHEILQLRERTETSSGLACVQVRYINKEGVETEFLFFAAGSHKGKSIVKIERVGEESSVLVSSNPRLILAYLASPFHPPLAPAEPPTSTGSTWRGADDAPPPQKEEGGGWQGADDAPPPQKEEGGGWQGADDAPPPQKEEGGGWQGASDAPPPQEEEEGDRQPDTL